MATAPNEISLVSPLVTSMDSPNPASSPIKETKYHNNVFSLQNGERIPSGSLALESPKTFNAESYISATRLKDQSQAYDAHKFNQWKSDLISPDRAIPDARNYM